MKAIIIDDEIAAVENLTESVKKLFPQLEVVGEAYSLSSGIALLKNQNPDLVFLDIDLKDGSGFALLEALDKINFQVIFVTAYNDYAIRAFQVNALDYVLKPLDDRDLGRAVQKAFDRHEQNEASVLKKILEEMRGGTIQKRLAIKDGKSIRYVVIKEVLRCESDKNYTDVFMQSGERIVASKTLKELEQILKFYGFFRIHQSHLVRLNAIREIIRDDGVFVKLINGDMLPVSRRKKDQLIEQMKEVQV